MKNFQSGVRLFAIALVLLVFAGLTNTFGQDKVIGKIFSKAEADKLFGPVLKSVVVPASEVKNILGKCQSYVMFDLDIDGAQPQLIAVDDARRPVNGYRKTVKSERVMHKYSKSKVEELLTLSSTDTITMETRSSVFTVSAGAYTLELSLSCPPTCF